MPRPRVSVVSFAPIHHDARVLRQVRCLARDYEVTVVGYGRFTDPFFPNVRSVPLRPPTSFFRRNLRDVPKLILGRLSPSYAYDRWYWGRWDHRLALEAIIKSRPDMITANDWDALPVAAEAARATDASLVLDLHEYSPLQRENRWPWMSLISPMIVHYLRSLGSSVDAFVTVNKTLADRYWEEFGFECTVVMNAPDVKAPPSFSPTAKDRIRLVHHGAAIPDRKLDTMIRALAHADPRYTLDFYLTGNNAHYVHHLRRCAEREAPGRVTFHDPVSPDDILDTIGQYDMGIFVLEPINFNYASALPNKFFDFVCAGLALCIGPTPEMQRLGEQYGFAVVADSFDAYSLGRTLSRLSSAEIDTLKRRSVAASMELNAQKQMAILRALHRDVLSHKTHAGSDSTSFS